MVHEATTRYLGAAPTRTHPHRGHCRQEPGCLAHLLAPGPAGGKKRTDPSSSPAPASSSARRLSLTSPASYIAMANCASAGDLLPLVTRRRSLQRGSGWTGRGRTWRRRWSYGRASRAGELAPAVARLLQQMRHKVAREAQRERRVTQPKAAQQRVRVAGRGAFRHASVRVERR